MICFLRLLILLCDLLTILLNETFIYAIAYKIDMVQESAFRGIINFLDKIGVYDVILPFLLVFSIMYAILEKTKVLGVDKDDKGREFTKKNLNSIVSFVIAFLVIASSKLVGLINEAMANVVILALVGVSVLMLLGVLSGTGEFSFSSNDWKESYTLMFFTAFMVLGVLLIFLHAIPYGNESLLEWFFDYMADNWDSEWVGSLVFIGLVSLFMWLIVNGEPVTNKKKEGES